MKLKLISREDAEDAISKQDCRGESYSNEVRDDIIKDILFGAEIQLEKILKDSKIFIKDSTNEFKKTQKEREEEIEKKMGKSI